MAENIGSRLSNWRKKTKLSQRALASALEVSQGYIGDIEAGRSEPSRNFLIKLQEKFNVRADYILYGEGDPVAPERGPVDPLMLMFCGAAVAQEYTALGLDLPRDTHYQHAVWMVGEVLARVTDPEDGDEFEAVMPGVRALLRDRLTKNLA